MPVATSLASSGVTLYQSTPESGPKVEVMLVKFSHDVIVWPCIRQLTNSSTEIFRIIRTASYVIHRSDGKFLRNVDDHTSPNDEIPSL